MSEKEICGTSQSIYFAKENVYDHNYKLIELDNYLVDELKVGNTLLIKGDDAEEAVLCTNDRTYNLIGAETSNSMLLLDNMKFHDDVKKDDERNVSKIAVKGIFYEYLTVSQSRPHLKKMIDILNKSPYKGPEFEYEIKEEDLYTSDQLKSFIQASDKELDEELNKMNNVVVINNKIRILDFDYHFRILSYMLKLIEENSWNLDQIDYDVTINSLEEIVPKDVLTGLFNKYTVESQIIDYVQLYVYKEAEICKFFAQVLLSAAEKFNYEDFLQAWRESVPEGMQTSEEFLYGIAVIKKNNNLNIIFAFPEEQLPEDINERFEILFNVKDKWTVPEITPYIQSVLSILCNFLKI